MYLLGLKYLEALPTLTQGKGTTIFLPTEATGVMGALGGLKELLARTGVQENTASETAGVSRPASGAYQPPRPQITATVGTPFPPPAPGER
jgi:hypothetical protein